MNEKTCCFTGHREIPEDKSAYVDAMLRKAVNEAIEDGYTRFISDFAEGTDLMFAAIVAEAKKQQPLLYLEAAIPYEGRLKNKDHEFQNLLTLCDSVKVLCSNYSSRCFFIRNRYMVSESSRVIAVYDGRARGGTLYTMRYASTQKRDLRIIEV